MKPQNSLFRFIQFTVLFLLIQAFLVNNAYSVDKGPKFYDFGYYTEGSHKLFFRIIKADGYGKSVEEINGIVNKNINENYGKKKTHVCSNLREFWWSFDGYHQTAIMYWYDASTKKFGWLAMNNYFYYITNSGETGTLDVGESKEVEWNLTTLKFENPSGEDWDADDFMYMFGWP